PRLDFEADGELFKSVPFDASVFGQERPEFGSAADSPNPFDWAYCVTAHKAQGDEWPDVLVFEQHCRHWCHRRWACPAASRASDRLFGVAPRPPFPSAAKGKGATR